MTWRYSQKLKTKKSKTLRLEFTFSNLISKVKKAFMELYQNVFKGLSESKDLYVLW